MSDPCFRKHRSVLMAEQVDQTCDRFEAAWKSAGNKNEPPHLEDYLGDVPEPERSALLRELIFLDIYYRRMLGEDAQPADYENRFPGLDPACLPETNTLTLSPEIASAPKPVPAAMPAKLPAIPGYEILDVLGRGGMGVVYRAWQIGLKRLVALKMIRDPTAATRRDLARFAVEAETAARLQHPNIAHVYEVGEQDGSPYFSFELLSGGSLHEQLAGGPLPAVRAAQLVETLARAVHYAHECGILHRDLKPANVLMTTEGVPKISDFGLAKLTAAGAVGQTQSGTILGTPSYMAPEQTRGQTKELGPAVDVYALGAILYETLTGRPPFRADTPLETMRQVQEQEPLSVVCLQPKVPRDLETICLKCLQKEPHERYASAEALANDLRRFLAGEPIQARPIRSLERALKWTRRRPAAAGLIGVSAAGILLLFAGGIWQSAQKEALELAQRLRVEAETQRARANQQESMALQYAYAAQMKSAHQFWLSGNLRPMVALLSSHANRPERSDLRDFVWYYLWALCHSERLTLRGHRQDIYCVAFSPDGKLLASAGRDATVRLWDAATGREQRHFSGHTDEVNWVAFSPDGQWLASASDDQTVRLWDRCSGHEVSCLRGHVGEVRCCAFSPDGKLLASAGDDRLVRLWDPITGKQLAEMAGHKDVIESLAFSPNGNTLATAGQDCRVLLWDMRSRRLLAAAIQQTDHVKVVAFSPGGRLLATGCGDGTVGLWDPATGARRAILRGRPNAVQSISFSPDSKTLVAGGDDGTVRVWDVAREEQRLVLKGHAERVWCVRFSPDGRTLATSSQDSTVKIWDPAVRQDRQTLPEDPATISSFAITPDNRLAVGRTDGTVRIWDVITRSAIQTIPCVQESGSVSSVGFSPDGKMLAAGTSQGQVTLWDFSAGQVPHSLVEKGRGPIEVTRFTDNRTLLTQARGEAVRFWDVTARRLRAPLPAAAIRGPSQAIAAEGRMLPTWTKSPTFVIWDIAKGRRLPAPCPLAVSPEGNRLAAWTIGEFFNLWDLTTGQPGIAPCRHSGISCIAFSPDGRIVASGGPSGVKLWDARTGRELSSRLTQEGHVVSLAFSPDGKILATGTQDRKVRLWHVATQQELVTLEGHEGTSQTLAFAPNGEMLAGAGLRRGGQEIYLWPAPREKP